MPYESEFTLFMRDMKRQHPEWAGQQRSGRALLWNKRVDFGELQRFAESSGVPDVCNYDATKIK